MGKKISYVLLVTGLVLTVLPRTARSAHEAANVTNGFKVAGKLRDAEDYTVLILARDGSVRSAKLDATGRFVFKNLPSDFVSGATLQLVDPSGRYYGPVVLGRNKKKSTAYTVLSGKRKRRRIKLGRIILKSGYAVTKRQRKAFVDRSQQATANAEGKPIGAGKSGLVSAELFGGSTGGLNGWP